MDIIDLRVLSESGTDREKWYAHRILPVRKHGNWLLCTLLIGNTAVNAALAIVTADIFGGITGFLSSTIAILYLGEIIPQAVCHRFGLVIGAYAIPLVRLLMFLTAPLSFTTAKILDFLLGGESATRYNKSQLKSLLSIHGTIQHDRNSQSPNQSRDFDAHINAVIASSGRADVTIIELQDTSSPLDDSAIDNPNQLDATGRPSQKDSHSPVRDSTDQSAPTVDIMPPDGSPRGRGNPVSRFFELTRAKFADRQPRKSREKRDKEKDSVSSNPPLTKDEVTMLGGAFDFSQKTVAQVMTSLDDVFMLEASLSLNFEVLLIIFQSGHSRVPVYDKKRDNIIGVLFAKDLILLDPEDCVPIKTVLLFFNRVVLLVYCDTTLNKMLNIFRQGGGHMAVVQQNKEAENSSSDTLGVVTLEDLIEELIGQDIVDETDVYTDNISKQRVKRVRSIDPEVLKMFDSKHDELLLSEKEVLVVSSYLSNNTEEFSQKLIDTNVLRRMLAEIPIVEYKEHFRERRAGSARGIAALAGTANMTPSDSGPEENEEISDSRSKSHQDALASNTGDDLAEEEGDEGGDVPDSRDVTIYTRGVPTKNAYLIINGKLEISAGSDGFISEAGPWTLLGVHALTDDIYAPDFTARVIERPARLLRVPRRLYRLMLQYSISRSRTAITDVNVGSRKLSSLSSSSPSGRILSAAKPPPKPPKSLAVAAAAVAAAVGTTGTKPKGPPLPGTAADGPVTRKTRSRPNGQSIEWSELEPSIIQNADKSQRDPPGQTREGTSEPSSRDVQEIVEVMKPLTGRRHSGPPDI